MRGIESSAGGRCDVRGDAEEEKDVVVLISLGS